jgi:hypothetical protein
MVFSPLGDGELLPHVVSHLAEKSQGLAPSLSFSDDAMQSSHSAREVYFLRLVGSRTALELHRTLVQKGTCLTGRDVAIDQTVLVEVAHTSILPEGFSLAASILGPLLSAILHDLLSLLHVPERIADLDLGKLDAE